MIRTCRNCNQPWDGRVGRGRPASVCTTCRQPKAAPELPALDGDCTHKVIGDFRVTPAQGDKPAVYRCSACGKIEAWGPTWGYWGTVECKRCGWADVEFVTCSAECLASQLVRRRMVRRPARGTK